ncbi:hypothetical protein ACQCX2_12590 [Propionibacteriaceae bacterium Y1700]|uniref:hypothetical protein n=1 Tax=Microlunatus sp. Y1700 TaxID=3418487 RepID=UPI003DA777E2
MKIPTRRTVATTMISLLSITTLLGACSATSAAPVSPEAEAAVSQAATPAQTPSPTPTPTPTKANPSPTMRTSKAPGKPMDEERKLGSMTEGACAVVKPGTAPGPLGKSISMMDTGSLISRDYFFFDTCGVRHAGGFVVMGWSAEEVTETDWEIYQDWYRTSDAVDSDVADGAFVDSEGTLVFHAGGRILHVAVLPVSPKATAYYAEKLIKAAGSIKSLPEHITQTRCAKADKVARAILGEAPRLVRQSIVRMNGQTNDSPSCGWRGDHRVITVENIGSVSDQYVAARHKGLRGKKSIKGLGKDAQVSVEMGELHFVTPSGDVVVARATDAHEEQLVALAKALYKSYR